MRSLDLICLVKVLLGKLLFPCARVCSCVVPRHQQQVRNNQREVYPKSDQKDSNARPHKHAALGADWKDLMQGYFDVDRYDKWP